MRLSKARISSSRKLSITAEHNIVTEILTNVEIDCHSHGLPMLYARLMQLNANENKAAALCMKHRKQ